MRHGLSFHECATILNPHSNHKRDCDNAPRSIVFDTYMSTCLSPITSQGCQRHKWVTNGTVAIIPVEANTSIMTDSLNGGLDVEECDSRTSLSSAAQAERTSEFSPLLYVIRGGVEQKGSQLFLPPLDLRALGLSLLRWISDSWS